MMFGETLNAIMRRPLVKVNRIMFIVAIILCVISTTVNVLLSWHSSSLTFSSHIALRRRAKESDHRIRLSTHGTR
jgi:hypothetical protein